jgi:hypothetical protein
METARSRSYHQSIAKALGTEPWNVHAEIARMAVLYEDMRLELTAARGDSYPDLDIIGPKHRKLYFLRRAVATAREFGEAIRQLQGDSNFRAIRREFEDTDAMDWWFSGVAFFKKNADYLQKIRNDFGGHFSKTAALYALRNIGPHVTGKIEINFKDGKANPKAFFVAPLVDEAMLGRRGDKDREEYAKHLIAFSWEAFRHAGLCMHVMLRFYLIPRFGR